MKSPTTRQPKTSRPWSALRGRAERNGRDASGTRPKSRRPLAEVNRTRFASTSRPPDADSNAQPPGVAFFTGSWTQRGASRWASEGSAVALIARARRAHRRVPGSQLRGLCRRARTGELPAQPGVARPRNLRCLYAQRRRPVRVERSEPRSGALDGPTSGATRVPVPAHALRAARQPESPATAGIRRALERSPHPRKQHKRPKWANSLSTGRSRRPHDCGVTYLRESGPRSESRVRVNGSGRRSGRVAQIVTSPVRSARSERQTRSGSARSRTARHSSRRGYIARTVSGRSRASLVR